MSPATLQAQVRARVHVLQLSDLFGVLPAQRLQVVQRIPGMGQIRDEARTVLVHPSNAILLDCQALVQLAHLGLQ